jgi:hypothetical protein
METRIKGLVKELLKHGVYAKLSNYIFKDPTENIYFIEIDNNFDLSEPISFWKSFISQKISDFEITFETYSLDNSHRDF